MLVIKEKIISIYPDFLGGTIIQPQLLIESSAFIYLFNLKKFLVMLHRHAKYRIFVPRPGIEPESPAAEAQSFNRWTAREVSRSVSSVDCPVVLSPGKS